MSGVRNWWETEDKKIFLYFYSRVALNSFSCWVISTKIIVVSLWLRIVTFYIRKVYVQSPLMSLCWSWLDCPPNGLPLRLLLLNKSSLEAPRLTLPRIYLSLLLLCSLGFRTEEKDSNVTIPAVGVLGLFLKGNSLQLPPLRSPLFACCS